MTKWNVAVVLLAAALAVLFTPGSASACSCAEVLSPGTPFERATAVFTGLVVSLEGPTGPRFSSLDPVTVGFLVDTVWKGPKQHELMVTTAVSSASCGFDFRIGCRYVVYATGPEDDLQVDICGGTRLLILADDDLGFLGNGEAVAGAPDARPPAAGDENAGPGDADRGFNYIALITLVSGVIIGIMIAAVGRHYLFKG